MTSALLEKFPELARYEENAVLEQDAAIAANFGSIYSDALKKTYDLARQRYCGAFFAGINFLEWARINVGADFAIYLDHEIAIDNLWCQKAPEGRFIAALRDWARCYLALARICHRAVIDEINIQLTG